MHKNRLIIIQLVWSLPAIYKSTPLTQLLLSLHAATCDGYLGTRDHWSRRATRKLANPLKPWTCSQANASPTFATTLRKTSSTNIKGNVATAYKRKFQTIWHKTMHKAKHKCHLDPPIPAKTSQQTRNLSKNR